MRCFLVVAPPDSAVDEERLTEVFGDRVIGFFTGVWFVAANKTVEQIGTELGVGEDAYSVIVALREFHGFASETVAVTLQQWGDHV